MKVNEVMTPNPVSCTADTGVPQAAELMVAHDCGALPVVESEKSHRPVGIVTDRDIVVRLVAVGEDVRQCRVADAMTDMAVTVEPEADVGEARRLMREHRLRRVMVTGPDGRCVGLVALADLAGSGAESETGAVVKDVSRPRTGSARVTP
jgi:CBS domain-containing protein